MATAELVTLPDVASDPSKARRGAHVVLAGVLAIFVLLCVVIAVKTPAFESADEPGHVENIETLASGHWYSMTPHCKVTGATILNCLNGTEAHQAPLYYLVMAGWQRLVGQPVEPPFNFLTHLNGPGAFGLHAETFTAHSAADHRYLLWLRLPNILFGALTVFFGYLAVRLITTDIWTPVVAASLVAFLPRFVFLSAFVTNDNLVNLFGALLVYLALRYALGPSVWRMVAVGGVIGLLVVTKLSTLPLALLVVPLALMVKGWGRRAAMVGVSVATALAFCGWYLIQNAVRYGDPLARTASARYLSVVGGLGLGFGQLYHVTDPLGLVLEKVPRRILGTFWYQSGWNQFHWPFWVNVVVTVAFVVAIVGLFHRGTSPRVLVTLFTIAALGFLCVWVVAFQTPTFQARYALVGLVALCGLAALGLERWRLPLRFVLPIGGLIGTVVAIQQDVLAIHWT